MSTVIFTCDISAPVEANFVLQVLCDDKIVAEYQPVNSHEFVHAFEDSVDTIEHSIEFRMRGKTPDHTLLNEQGEIIKDHLLLIQNKRFENIDVNYAFDRDSVYTHNFNGTATETQDTFCGILGCNGSVKFEFTTPIYLWMLENL